MCAVQSDAYTVTSVIGSERLRLQRN